MPISLANQLPAFVGRQPIFDRMLSTEGYELLFRMAGENHSVEAGSDGTALTAQVVLSAFVEIGLENVVGDKLAFINATRTFLCDELAFQLPAGRVVIEVLEDITPDADVLDAVTRLRTAGYTIALDDFIYHPALAPLVNLANIIKIDITRLSRPELVRHAKLLARPGCQLLAEKLETAEEFEQCKALGFDLFQGYFLAKPTVVTGARRTSNYATALRLLALLDDPTTPLDEVEAALRLDPTLSYRLLRVINSAAFSLRHHVDSLRQALVMLGLRRVQGWVTLMVLAGLSKKPPAVLETALTRARMCEQLGTRLDPSRAPSYFTVGLFSALDAMLDTPLPTIVSQLPLSPDVSAALLGGEGAMGRVLRSVLAYERCQWDLVSLPGLTDDEIRRTFLDALQWVQSALDQQAATS